MSGSALYECFTTDEIMLLNQFVDILLQKDECGLTHKQLMECYFKRHGNTIKCSPYGVHKITELYDKFQPILDYDGNRVCIDSALKSELRGSVKSVPKKYKNNDNNNNNNNNINTINNLKTATESVTSVGCQTETTTTTKVKSKPKFTTVGCQAKEKVTTVGCQTKIAKKKGMTNISCQTEMNTMTKLSPTNETTPDSRTMATTSSQACQTDDIANIAVDANANNCNMKSSKVLSNESSATNTDLESETNQPISKGPVEPGNTSLVDVSLVGDDQSMATDDENEFLYETADRKEPDGQTRSSPARSDLQNLNAQTVYEKMTKTLSDLQEHMIAIRKDLPRDQKDVVTTELNTLNEVLTSVKTTCSTLQTQSFPTLLKTCKDLSKKMATHTKEFGTLKTEMGKNAETVLSLENSLTQRLSEHFNPLESSLKQLGENSEQYKTMTAANFAEILRVSHLLAVKVNNYSEALNVKNNDFYRQNDYSAVLNELRSSMSSLLSKVDESNLAVLGLQSNLQQYHTQSSGQIVKVLDKLEAKNNINSSVTNIDCPEDFGPIIFVCRYCRQVPRSCVVIDVGCGGLIGCEDCVGREYSPNCPRCKKGENFQVLTTGWEVLLKQAGVGS